MKFSDLSVLFAISVSAVTPFSAHASGEDGVVELFKYLERHLKSGVLPEIVQDQITSKAESFTPNAADKAASKKVQQAALDLLENSRDYNQVWNTLDQLGLRTKLVELGGAIGDIFNRMPLPDFAIGKGTGLTAKALGIKYVMYQTQNITEWYASQGGGTESSPAKAFQSRENVANEVAILGEGYYTVAIEPGKNANAFRDGMLPSFHAVAEDAREYSDFTVREIAGTKYVVFKNARAIPTITDHSFPGEFRKLCRWTLY